MVEEKRSEEMNDVLKDIDFDERAKSEKFLEG